MSPGCQINELVNPHFSVKVKAVTKHSRFSVSSSLLQTDTISFPELFQIALLQRRLGNGAIFLNGPTRILHENHPSAYVGPERRAAQIARREYKPPPA
jgi:hypothetical protein